MKHPVAEIFGWYGAIVILVTFFLVTFNYMEPESLIYPLLNGTGAAGIAIQSYYKRAFPAVLLNAVYFLIAIVAIARYFI